MQKVSVRNGCIFRCAWLPPTLVTIVGLRDVKFVAGAYRLLAAANRFAIAIGVVAFELLAFTTWVWVGISAIESVWACSPPLSPSVCPLPTWIGTRPRLSGRAKFTRPSPPKVVPSREKRAWF